MTNQQGAPEALRLADIADDEAWAFVIGVRKEIAAELRRLHAENERLAALVEAQPPACDTARYCQSVQRCTAKDETRAQQPAPSAAANEQRAGIPGNFITHRAAWRKALERCKITAANSEASSYWEHEIAAFDRSFDRLWALMQPSPTPQADSAPVAICNACGADLLEVKQSPNSYLSAEQFDADKLGDWYCKCCPKGPSEGSSTHRYFWNRDLGAAAPQADSQPAPVRVSKDRLPNWSVESHMDAIPDPVASVTTSDARVVTPCRAARAPADSVTAPAGGVVAVPRETLRAWRQWCAQSMSHAIEHEISDFLAAPTPPAQAADSVLEDAAPQAAIDNPYPSMTARHEAFEQGVLKTLAAFRAKHAARRQGGAT